MLPKSKYLEYKLCPHELHGHNFSSSANDRFHVLPFLCNMLQIIKGKAWQYSENVRFISLISRSIEKHAGTHKGLWISYCTIKKYFCIRYENQDLNGIQWSGLTEIRFQLCMNRSTQMAEVKSFVGKSGEIFNIQLFVYRVALAVYQVLRDLSRCAVLFIYFYYDLRTMLPKYLFLQNNFTWIDYFDFWHRVNFAIPVSFFVSVLLWRAD